MMTDPESRYQSLLSKLQARGSRITSHRLALLRLIAASQGHPSAAQLHQQLRAQFPTASLATIYKTLELLKAEGEVLEIPLRGESRYDGNKPYPHPHLICSRCGAILDGDQTRILPILQEEIEVVYNFRISQAHLVVVGVCRDCQLNPTRG